jgi:hypothetical protein
MDTLKLVIGCAWVVFWIYWLASASTSKESVASGWRSRLSGVSGIGLRYRCCAARRRPGCAQRDPGGGRGAAVRLRDRAGGLGPGCIWGVTGERR